MIFLCIKSEPTTLQPIHVPPFVDDDELSATYKTRCLIVNKKLQIIYTSETVYPQFPSCNFCLNSVQ